MMGPDAKFDLTATIFVSDKTLIYSGTIIYANPKKSMNIEILKRRGMRKDVLYFCSNLSSGNYGVQLLEFS